MQGRLGLFRWAELILPAVATLIALGGSSYYAFLVTHNVLKLLPEQDVALFQHHTLFQDHPSQAFMTVVLATLPALAAIVVAAIHVRNHSLDALYMLFGLAILTGALPILIDSALVPTLFPTAGVLLVGAIAAYKRDKALRPVIEEWIEPNETLSSEKMIDPNGEVKAA